MKNMEIFEEKYKKLNPAQKEAVDTIDGPVMVVAGPGTGKTTILTLRIANILLQTDTPPSGILALTFTEAGVKAMKSKLREVIGSRADEVRIHTFHSFAASVISEFDDHFPSVSRASQITEVEAEMYVRSILEDVRFAKLRPLGDPEFYVGKIIGAISDCKREAWTPDVVRKFATEEIERIQNDPDAISTRGSTKGQIKAEFLKRIERCQKTILFSDVYEAYEMKKVSERKIDFDDLIFQLITALGHDELLLRILQEKFLYILVDEHQDTNDSQNLVISHLADFFDTPNIFVVGDEKQAIYRFQGASVQNFLRFQDIWKSMKVISLTQNYRSHQSILDATYGMIENNYTGDEYRDLRIKLTAHSKHSQKPIDYVLAGNNCGANEYLVTELRHILDTEPDSKVAVIVRRNKDVEAILSLCETNNIPASAERGADIFSHPVGALYFDLLEYVIDPTYVEGLAKSIVAGFWHLDFKKSIELIQKLRARVPTNIQDEIPELRELQSEMMHLGVLDYLILIADRSGILDRASENPTSAEVWHSIMDLARDLAVRGNISDPRKLIAELLLYKKTAETKSIKMGAGIVMSPVTIMTAHGSKGLEYDYVFLPFANEETWMHRSKTAPFVLPREKGDLDEVKDSRRLFYVVLTRTRKHAVIIASEQDSAGRELLPLRFIDELDVAHIERKTVSAGEEPIVGISKEHLQSQRAVEIMEYTKRVILENGLSVTALNHFLECPSTFLYKSVLKLPEAPSATSEKGIAMHKALSLVWKSEDKSTEAIQDIILKTVDEHFKTSLLPAFEKEVILRELTESAPQIAIELQSYFNTSGDVATEKWVETHCAVDYHGSPVELQLHGQLDVIREQQKTVEVFDYKTTNAKSINEIRGETKNSDGNYFRQLIYYKILLEKNSKYADKEILPSLIFIKPDDKGRCPTVSVPITSSDTDRVYSEIASLVHAVWSGEFLQGRCDTAECKWCKLKMDLLSK